jgi:hypothetical protein
MALFPLIATTFPPQLSESLFNFAFSTFGFLDIGRLVTKTSLENDGLYGV